MVALYNFCIALSRLDNVGIYSSLRKEVSVRYAESVRLVAENITELRSDYMTFCLRVRNSRKLVKKTFFGIDADKIDVPFFECRFYLVALVLSHKTVVNKNASQSFAYRLTEKRRKNRRVNTARTSQQHSSVLAYLLTQMCDGRLAEIAHRPTARCVANFVKEVSYHLKTVLRVIYFRMELNAVKSIFFIRNCNIGASVAVCNKFERRR